MKMIVGLGNPGKQYEMTRHNVGFLCLDSIESKYRLTFKFDSSFNAMVATSLVGGEKCVFVKPQTYMNLSGEAIIKVAKYYKVAVEDILVIYDDMDLPLGSLRLREKGSAGGHNGIKSIIAHLNTQEFKRIRVGISSHANIDAKDYVLGRFSKDEQITLALVRDQVVNAVDEFIANKPFVIVMGNYNGDITKRSWYYDFRLYVKKL